MRYTHIAAHRTPATGMPRRRAPELTLYNPLSLSLSLYAYTHIVDNVYIYIYIYVCMYVLSLCACVIDESVTRLFVFVSNGIWTNFGNTYP